MENIKTSIYEKINIVKETILNTKLKKSGKNNFSNFEYFELQDFLPTIIKSCKENKLFTKFNFFNEKMILEIIDIDSGEKLEYETPTRTLQLKGCNELQALGGIQTYLRRYLLMLAFDIVEADLFDANVGNKDFNEEVKVNNNNISFKELKDILLNCKSIKELEDNVCYYKDKINLKYNEKKELNDILLTIKEALKINVFKEMDKKEEIKELDLENGSDEIPF